MPFLPLLLPFLLMHMNKVWALLFSCMRELVRLFFFHSFVFAVKFNIRHIARSFIKVNFLNKKIGIFCVTFTSQRSVFVIIALLDQRSKLLYDADFRHFYGGVKCLFYMYAARKACATRKMETNEKNNIQPQIDKHALGRLLNFHVSNDTHLPYAHTHANTRTHT